MHKKLISSLVLVFSIVIFVACILLLFLLDLRTASRLEIGLLSLLQFLSTLTITIFVSRSSIEKDVRNKHHDFAKTSYSRVKAIKDTMDQITVYIKRNFSNTLTLDAMMISFKSLSIEINNALKDWKTIIGDDPDILDNDMKTKMKLNDIKVLARHTSYLSKAVEDLQKKYNKIDPLFKTEPEVSIDPVIENRFHGLLLNELIKHNCIRLSVFWKEGYTEFLSELIIGEKLYITEEKHEEETTLCIVNSEGEIVGGICNDYGYKYYIVREGLIFFTEEFSQVFQLESVNSNESNLARTKIYDNEKEYRYYIIKSIEEE